MFALDDIPAEGDTPEITLPDIFTHPAAYSLDSDGTAKELEFQSTEKNYTFQTNGSPYYILAEKDPTETPTPSPTPTEPPTETPTPTPTKEPTQTPTETPTQEPTQPPTKTSTKPPSLTPSPTKVRSVSPTLSPTKTPDSQTGKDTKNPSTGDQTTPGKWMAGMIVSGIGILAVYRKKKENN